MNKLVLIIGGILLKGIITFGQPSMWQNLSEGVCDSSIVENKYADDITKQLNPVYLGRVNPEYYYTFNWDGKLYVLAYRTNDKYYVRHVNEWREERDVLLYRFEGVGNWVLASDDIIRTDWRKAGSFDLLLYAGYDGKQNKVFIENGKVVILLLTEESDYYTNNYYHERIELIPIENGKFRVIKNIPVNHEKPSDLAEAEVTTNAGLVLDEKLMGFIKKELSNTSGWDNEYLKYVKDMSHEINSISEFEIGTKELKVAIVKSEFDEGCPPYCGGIISIFEFAHNQTGWILYRSAKAFTYFANNGKIEYYQFSQDDYGIKATHLFNSAKYGNGTRIDLFNYLDGELTKTFHYFEEEGEIELKTAIIAGVSYLQLGFSSDGSDQTKYYKFNVNEYNEYEGSFTDPRLYSIISYVNAKPLTQNNNIIYPTDSSLKQDTKTFIDSRDGKVYKTVKIGSQTWMAENLAYKTDEGCLAYNNNETHAKTYGYLYTWNIARMVCPSGWHLPSLTEWNTLIECVGNQQYPHFIAGNKLRESGFKHWKIPADAGWELRQDAIKAEGTNDFGFTALPAGLYFPLNSSLGVSPHFGGIGENTIWWVNTNYNSSQYAYTFEIRLFSNEIHRNYSGVEAGFSVRCIKD